MSQLRIEKSRTSALVTNALDQGREESQISPLATTSITTVYQQLNSIKSISSVNIIPFTNDSIHLASFPPEKLSYFCKKLIYLSHKLGINDQEIFFLRIFLQTVDNACKTLNCVISDLGYDETGILVFINKCDDNIWEKIIEAVDLKYKALLQQYGEKVKDARGSFGVICENAFIK